MTTKNNNKNFKKVNLLYEQFTRAKKELKLFSNVIFDQKYLT